MNDVLSLEPPFYLPEAIDQFVRPALPRLITDEIPSSALDDPKLCEAFNRALKFSIERRH